MPYARRHINGRPVFGPANKPKAKPKGKRKFRPFPRYRIAHQAEPGKFTVRVAECTQDYVTALCNPFLAWREGIKACVPDNIVLPSSKRSFHLQGSFYSGSTGVGYAMMNPHALSANVGSITHTIATSVGTFATTYDDFTLEEVDAGPTEAPQSSEYGSLTLKWRVVGCGIKVWYAGREDTRGGTMYSIQAQSGEDISAKLLSTGVNQSGTVRISINHANSVISSVWRPKQPRDLEYNWDVTTLRNPQLAIIVDTPDAGMKFEYEAVWHYEFIGDVAGKWLDLSESTSDPTGLASASKVAEEWQKRPGVPSRDQAVGGVKFDIATSNSSAMPVRGFMPMMRDFKQRGEAMYDFAQDKIAAIDEFSTSFGGPTLKTVVVNSAAAYLKPK